MKDCCEIFLTGECNAFLQTSFVSLLWQSVNRRACTCRQRILVLLVPVYFHMHVQSGNGLSKGYFTAYFFLIHVKQV